MSNQNKRIFIGQEKSNDEVGVGRRPPSLSSPSNKKVKKEQDDTESLEIMTEQKNLNTRNEEISNLDDVFYNDPSDDPDDDISTLSTDDVFKKICIPQKVQDFYRKKRNISNLYDWQKKCITNPNLLNGDNYILSLKTGAGKTLIAELLMLRESIVKNRSCLVILPYKAIVREIIINLSAFEELGIFVEEYTGSGGMIPPVKKRKGQNIYVATIERANTLIDSLIRENRFKEIGLFVVDGLHVIGEKARGDTVEKLIFKYLMFGSGQIIGMSSALGTIDRTNMCKFVEAKLFSSDFQPGKVTEKVMMGGYLYNVNEEGDLILPTEMKINDINRNVYSFGLVSLIKNIVQQKSVLIFCPTRRYCECVCEMVATPLPVSSEEQDSGRQNIIDIIKKNNGGKINKTLEIGIRAGVAYHHAGLTEFTRHCIETAFTFGYLYAICATSTLAAGVNLPVECVIISEPRFGKDFLEKSRYLQMIGRASRAGYEGESITLVSADDEKEFRDMLKPPLKSCRSQILEEDHLKNFIMNLIYLKLVKKVEGLRDFLSKTLAGIQYGDEYLSLMEETLENLKEEGKIKIENGVISILQYHQSNFYKCK